MFHSTAALAAILFGLAFTDASILALADNAADSADAKKQKGELPKPGAGKQPPSKEPPKLPDTKDIKVEAAEGDTAGAIRGKPGTDGGEAADRLLTRLDELIRRLATLEARILSLEGKMNQRGSDTVANNPTNPTTTPGKTPDETGAQNTPVDLGKLDPKEVLKKLPGGVIKDTVMEQIANAELKGRFGKLVVTFPKGAKCDDEILLYDAGNLDKYNTYANGGYDKELLPGSYGIVVHKTRIEGFTVVARKETRIPLGAVRLIVGADTAWEIYPVGGKTYITWGNGPQDVGLIPGKYEIEVLKKRETVTVKAGELVEF